MPTPEMRQAMATAPLGDDVFGDDPMVNELEQVAASMLAKEAALFLPSGTMGNVVGVAVNTRLGEEMIADADSHYGGGQLRGHPQPPRRRRLAAGRPARGVRCGSGPWPPRSPRRREDLQRLGGSGN
jgi:hypothetical protein